MARSRGPRPCVPSRQASSDPPESTAWITGASTPKGLSSLACPGLAAEKAVKLMITLGGAEAKVSARKAREPASFRLLRKIGNGRRPRADRTCVSACTGARSPACTSAR